MSTFDEVEGDLFDVEMHRLRFGEGQNHAGSNAAGGTDRAERIGALVALVGELDRPHAAPRPLADQTILLADARQVPEMGRERGGEVF